MIFVVDNNIFSRTFKNVSLDIFDDIWKPWSELMQEGIIISVNEVYNELVQRWGEETPEGTWLKAHKQYFLKPTQQEGFIMENIFKNKKFREGIKEASLRNGTPEADAFIVAKAKHVDGIVVTAESDQKPNSEKIPNMSVSLEVPYMKLNDFYKLLRNRYHKNPLVSNVKICKSLGIEEDF